MLPDPVLSLLQAQDGVATRAQLLSAGAHVFELQRWRRQRLLVMLSPGVYVDHTGTPSWRQRAIAGVLACAPAALWGASALHAHEGTDGGHGAILVAVSRERRLDGPEGVRVVRRPRLAHRVLWSASPPRQRYDDAVIDLALASRDLSSAVAVLTSAVQRRWTTAGRLRLNLLDRPQPGQRANELVRLLTDIAGGTHSVLEHHFLDRVERAHALPASQRQEIGSISTGRIYRDASYGSLVVELDSRAFHDSAAQRDADFERDLDTAIEGRETVRLTYGQVVDRCCSTAGKLAFLLMKHGWAGTPRACGAECVAPATFLRT